MTVTRTSNGLLTGTTVGSVSDTWGYDAYGAVTSHGVTGSATAFNVTITRDTAGRISLRTEAIGGTTHTYLYGYDSAGRLASMYKDGATTPTSSWTYDGNGNRYPGTYDDQDRMTAFGSATYTYGNNGELVSKTLAGVTTNYNYDAIGNLRGVSAPGLAITYAIDGLSRRVGKTKGGVFQGFLYDGARIVAELDSAGAILSRFIYATRGDSPDYVIRGGATYRIVKDHLGSPRLLVSSLTGAVAQRIDYDEWGNITTDTSPGFQPFGFAGGLWDRDAGLVRFGTRDYDPAVGRWTAKDRIRFAGGTNLFAYSDLDPINFVDRTGLSKSQCEKDESPRPRPPPPPPDPPIPDPILDCEVSCSDYYNNGKPADCNGVPNRPPPSAADKFLCEQSWDLQLNSCLNWCGGGLPASPIPTQFPRPSDHPDIRASR